VFAGHGLIAFDLSYGVQALVGLGVRVSERDFAECGLDSYTAK
jgi:hypothetical protein